VLKDFMLSFIFCAFMCQAKGIRWSMQGAFSKWKHLRKIPGAGLFSPVGYASPDSTLALLHAACTLFPPQTPNTFAV